MNNRILTTILFCCILLLTNRWLSYEEGISILKAADTQSYMTIAQAAPALPQATSPETMLPTNHSARFIIPYFAGTIAHFTGIAHERIFLVMTLIFCAIVVVTSHKLFNELGVNDTQYALLMALLVFNPYTFRYYLAVPAMVNDIVFVAGLTLTMLGLVRGVARQGLVIILVGSIIAIAGRQNALVYLPALGVWMLWGENWRTSNDGLVKRLVRFGIVAVSIVAVYIVIGRIIASFSVQGMEGDALTGFIRWVIAPSAGKMKVFAEYGLRTVIALLFPLCMLFGAAFAFRFRGVSLLQFFVQMPRDFWFALCFVAALYGFAFLGGPDLFMSGVTRYVSHALPAMLCALAMAMVRHNLFARVPDSLSKPQSPVLMMLCGVMTASSFHHMTTFGGSTSDKAMYFAVIYCILAIFAGLLTYHVERRTE
jgi:hypothetical protein